jgi:hypothetical protein
MPQSESRNQKLRLGVRLVNCPLLLQQKTIASAALKAAAFARFLFAVFRLGLQDFWKRGAGTRARATPKADEKNEGDCQKNRNLDGNG